MEFETIEVTAEDAVGRIMLNRPDRLNAITLRMLEELIDAARWFDRQTDIRVVTVSGNGRSFCAGYDIDGFSAFDGDAVERREQSLLGGRMADAIERMRAVTVARLHGWIVGGGVVIAAGCDLRVAAEDVRFKIPEVELGIPLNWAGIPRLVREIGPALTKELVMTCREFSADEAKGAGLLNRVVAPDQLDDEVSALVDVLVSMPAVPVLATKDQVNAVTTAMAARVGYYMDGDGMSSVMATDEFAAGFAEYVKKLDR